MADRWCVTALGDDEDSDAQSELEDGAQWRRDSMVSDLEGSSRRSHASSSDDSQASWRADHRVSRSRTPSPTYTPQSLQSVHQSFCRSSLSHRSEKIDDRASTSSAHTRSSAHTWSSAHTQSSASIQRSFESSFGRRSSLSSRNSSSCHSSSRRCSGGRLSPLEKEMEDVAGENVMRPFNKQEEDFQTSTENGHVCPDAVQSDDDKRGEGTNVETVNRGHAQDSEDNHSTDHSISPMHTNNDSHVVQQTDDGQSDGGERMWTTSSDDAWLQTATPSNAGDPAVGCYGNAHDEIGPGHKELATSEPSSSICSVQGTDALPTATESGDCNADDGGGDSGGPISTLSLRAQSLHDHCLMQVSDQESVNDGNISRSSRSSSAKSNSNAVSFFSHNIYIHIVRC